jgi:NAD(P)H-hydrate epimerase
VNDRDVQVPIYVPVYTAEQVRRAERPLLDAGVPLMRWAAASLASVIADHLEPGTTRRLLILAGRGDNGGDALYAAAELLHGTAAHQTSDDLHIDILLTSDSAHAQALTAAEAAGARRVSLDEASTRQYDLIVDGILGIGTSKDPALRGGARTAVEALLPSVREGRARVIAVDLPSGLHPDDGTTGTTGTTGVVLPASVTVTFGGVKAGLTRGQGQALAGAIVFVDFDLPFDAPPVGTASVAQVVDGRRDRG